MNMPEEVLNNVVHRLAEAVHPTRIILFGSAARGEMTEHSDLDLLIVVPDGSDPRETWKAAYKSLRRLGYPKDLLVIAVSDLEAHAHNPGLVYAQALREGRELYHAA